MHNNDYEWGGHLQLGADDLGGCDSAGVAGRVQWEKGWWGGRRRRWRSICSHGKAEKKVNSPRWGQEIKNAFITCLQPLQDLWEPGNDFLSPEGVRQTPLPSSSTPLLFAPPPPPPPPPNMLLASHKDMRPDRFWSLFYDCTLTIPLRVRHCHTVNIRCHSGES